MADIRKQLITTSLSAKMLFFRIDGTSTRSILDGSTDATLPSSGTTGIYVLSLNAASAKTPVIVGASALTEDLTFKVAINSNNKDITITWANLSGTDTDTDFHLTVCVFENSAPN
jgi:hypothetical protein